MKVPYLNGKSPTTHLVREVGLEPTMQPGFNLENLPFRHYYHSLMVCIFAFYKLTGTFVLLNLSLCNTQKPTHNLNLVVRTGFEPVSTRCLTECLCHQFSHLTINGVENPCVVRYNVFENSLSPLSTPFSREQHKSLVQILVECSPLNLKLRPRLYVQIP
jgi:hypothetical protein